MLLLDRRHWRHWSESELAVAQQNNMNPKLLSSEIRISERTLPALNSILASLVDFCENAKTLPHLQSWSGRYPLGAPDGALANAWKAGQQASSEATNQMGQMPTGAAWASPGSATPGFANSRLSQRTSPRLLCELWRAEELRLGVRRDIDTGTTADSY